MEHCRRLVYSAGLQYSGRRELCKAQLDIPEIFYGEIWSNSHHGIQCRFLWPQCQFAQNSKCKRNVQLCIHASERRGARQGGNLSAFINDVSPEMMYAQLVYGYGRENDLLIGISTSGNSKNVVNAVRVAKAIGVKTLSLTGKADSELSLLSDVTIKVLETETYKVQELHLPVYHYLCAKTEDFFWTV